MNSELLQSIDKDKEKEERFTKPWPKLDKGSKMNRISQFVKLQKTEHELNDEEEKKLKIMLSQLCENGSLNKTADVTYDIETKRIETIKHLTYNEDDKTYTFKKPLKKPKSTPTKSKSNVERHFSRSLK